MKALSCAVLAVAGVALTGCYTEPKVTVTTPAAVVPATAVVGAPGTVVTPAPGTTVVVPSR